MILRVSFFVVVASCGSLSSVRRQPGAESARGPRVRRRGSRRPIAHLTPASSFLVVGLRGPSFAARSDSSPKTSTAHVSSSGSARGSTCGIAPDVDCASTRGRGLYAYGHNTRARRSGTPPARVVTGTWRHAFTAGVLRSETPSTSERRARARHQRPRLRGMWWGRDIPEKLGARRETRGGRVGYAC